ncbi:MAG TPA: flagellar protein, partial [Thermoanaerobacterales bacterium]|nr:flagellar protein [Thermoanaerobacterales bacterium]
MDNKIRWQSQPIIPPKTTKTQPMTKQKKHEHSKSLDFKEILETKIKEKDSLKFSKHAKQRIKSRKIKINESDLLKINEAVNKAAEKGIKDSLILFDDVAFIVSVN